MRWRSPSASRSSTRGLICLAAASGAALAAAVASIRHRRVETRRTRTADEREAERAWLSAQVITAEQEERRRLSLGLHDGPLQSLSGIALMHDAALKALHAGRVEEAATVLEAALDRERETIQTLRDLSFALEPVVLRDRGLSAAVAALADQIRTARGIDVDVELAATTELGEKAQVALYQTIREALDQALRRRPATIAVRAERQADETFVVTVSDDGVGERRRGSVDAIGERARTLNGKVTVVSRKPRGTLVRVQLPGYVAAV